MGMHIQVIIPTILLSIAMRNELQVSGMSCSGCELLVKDALEELEGVSEATASHLKGTVVVDYDQGMVSIATITSVIEELGYKVNV
jgi:copper chaperone